MIAAALASALAATEELTLWHAYRGEERQVLEDLGRRYGEIHPETTVLPIFVPHENLANKLTAAIPRGNGPDLFVFAHERIGTWSGERLVLPVDLDATAFRPVAVEAVSYGGQTWAWPLACKSVALVRNRALVAEAPATTDAMVAAARANTRDDRYGLAFEVASAYYDAPWLHGFGGGVFRDGTVALDQPENARALEFVRGLATTVVPPDPTGAIVTQLFNEGRAAMVISGPWFLGEVAAGIDVAVSPLPVVSETGLPAAPYVGVESLFLARDTATARSFAEWLVAPEQAEVRAREGRQLVATSGIAAGEPALAAFAQQLETGRAMPSVPAMGETWEPLARALRRVMRGSASPGEALAEAQALYESFSQPVPARASAMPYLVAAALVLVAGLAWGLRSLRGVDPRRWVVVAPWVGPALAAMGVLVVIPFLVGAGMSLFEYDGAAWRFVGAVRFGDILLSRDFPVTSPFSFWSTLVVTIAWTLANVALHVGLGVAIAMLLREPWVRMRGAARALLILPWAVPSYLTALAWKGMFHRQFGAVNALLSWVGAEPVSWFSSTATAFCANLVTNTWLGFPFMMVVTLGALQSIPRELEEAAEIDGAGAWDRFVHVTLPLLKPALLPAVILGSVWTFNQFNVIYLVSGGEPDGTTDILVSQAYRWAFTRGHRYGYAAAYGVIIFGVLVAYGRAANRFAGRKVV